jgi:ABC-2 type transport system ATP-binding protein
LDEPTAGVDVELRKNLWENVKTLNKEGVTIILTTHYLFEAQEMCDRIAIIDKGNLVALDTTQKLLDRIQTKKITFKVSKIPNDKILSLPNVQFNSKVDNTVTAIYEKNSYKFDDIVGVLKKNYIEILDISTEDGNLEDVFVKLTNN